MKPDTRKFVVHCKKSTFDIYIGRPSKRGNPFKNGAKEENIQNYETWIKSKPELLEQAKAELRGKVLACWCAPKECHGHILSRIANEDN